LTSIKQNLAHTKSIFDGWRSITIALYMSLVGYAVLVGIPVISTAWVELLGFTEEQVGRVAGADLGGLSFGAVIASILVGRVNRRYLVLLGAGLAMLGNGLCMVFESYEIVLWLRVIAGLGSGIYTAVAVATLGGTANPAMAYNLMLFAFAFSQALELKVLPMLSMNGIYTAFIGTYVVGLLFLHWLPARPVAGVLEVEVDVLDNVRAEEGGSVEGPEHQSVHQPHHLEHRHIPASLPWLCLLAIFFTYINIGAYWTYVELAALDAGIDSHYVGSLLVWVSLFSVIGCLVATLISRKFGLGKPLLLSLLIMAGTVALLSGEISEMTLMTSLFTFNLLWVFIDVYQMATVATLDHSGKYAALIPGAQGLGQIAGPNLAASIIGAGLGYGNVFLMCGAAALAGLMVYAVMHLRMKRIIPSP
jgi:predicted MFS family arabinose efflux permease